MPYTVEDYRKDIKERALKMMSLEERLKGIPPEEIFKRFSPEEIFKRFSPEERLKGLSAEEIEACLKKMRKPKRKRKA